MKKYLQSLNIALIVTLFLAVNLFAQTATAPTAGDGSQGNPYQISSLDNLYWLSQNSSEWASGKYFIQTASIDASTTSSWDGGNGFTPIGNSSTNFSGTYNGNGHAILGLYINRGYYTGLFGYVHNGEITNVGLSNCSITGSYKTGALIGYLSYGTVSNCYSKGEVIGDSYLGGLIGESANGTISECFSECTVNGNLRLGGFIGYHYGGTISNCYSMGNVTRTDGNKEEIGGFCGSEVVTSSTVLKYCYSTGRVQYSNGSNPINKGFAGTKVNSGGFFASNFFDHNTSHQSSDAAGIAEVKNTIFLQNAATYTNIGYSWDFINNPNNDNNNDDIWGINPQINDGYPFLAWAGYSNYLEQPATGDGSSGNPYQITDLQDLYWVSQIKTAGKYFTQTSNIDASVTSSWCNGMGFIPIGENYGLKFAGTYDGNGHSIDGLFINRDDNYIGLFGSVQDGIIKNIGITNVNISGNITYAGALAGYLSGSGTVVTNCYSSGTVTGSYHIGGLLGDISTSVNVKISYSNCSVTGYNTVGGLLGQIYEGVVRNSYSKGTVQRQGGSSTFLGGFCGYISDGTIEYCYSTGKVEYNGTSDPTDKGFLGAESGYSTYTANFFDSETSLQTWDAVGAALAKTTSEMKNYTTFTTAGWDFVDETDNGSNDYWDADQNATVNDGYVILSWQSGADNTLPVELTTFSANIVKNKIQLNWQTATEVNNYGFEIQRQNQEASNEYKVSSNENQYQEWQSIAFVEGHGNSNSPKDYSFIDDAVNAGKYFYRLKQLDIDGSFKYSNVIEVNLDKHLQYKLNQNYPNPFNPTTTLSFSIPQKEFVSLAIYNSLGEKVTDIVNKDMQAGTYKFTWNAEHLTSGVYFSRFSAGSYIKVKKITLVK